MTIARKSFPFLAALFLFLVAGGGAPIGAQEEGGEGEVVCWWCWEFGGSHIFLPGGERCVSSIPGHGHPLMHCSRCGGTSECHVDDWGDGDCHRACGPSGDALAALTEIREVMEGDDVTVMVSALLRPRTTVSVDFLPEQGRIDVVLPCDPDRVFGTVPVLPGVRAMLEAELQSRSTASATPELSR